MSVLYFSDAVLNDTNGAGNQCLLGSTPLYLGAGTVYTFAANVPSLVFFQGTIPDTTTQNAFTIGSRSTDALLTFSLAGAYTRVGKVFTANFGTTAFGAINQAGTMTWFVLGNTDTHTARPMLFGTVGLTGSGADLILPKITVATNDLWLCTNLSWTINNVAVFA